MNMLSLFKTPCALADGLMLVLQQLVKRQEHFPPRPGSEQACRGSVSGNGARVMDFSAGLECRAGRTVDPENKPGGNCFPMETSKLTFENTCTILQKKHPEPVRVNHTTGRI